MHKLKQQPIPIAPELQLAILMEGTCRVCQKFSYPLVLWTSTILNLVVRHPKVLVQKVLLKTQNNRSQTVVIVDTIQIEVSFQTKLDGLL